MDVNEAFLMPCYRRLPLAFTHGRGARLYDTDGREYLDFIAGIGVNCLGHAHPQLVAAISEQAGKMLHCSNQYQIPEQARLAARLCRLTGLGGAFFCNSGAEANEAAFKLARLYQSRHGRSHAFQVVSLKNSFHGRTLATLAATGSSSFHYKFQPLPQGFPNWPVDLKVFEELLDQTCAAVIVEVVQGERGVMPLPQDFLIGLQALCRQRQILLIVDEVQSGVGRSGRFLACQKIGLTPDLVTMAKGLAGGVPIGAVLATPQVAAVLEPGDHGSTFGGNPLAVAAAHQVLNIVSEEAFLNEVERKGRRLQELLRKNLAAYGLDCRGLGLMLALYSVDNKFEPGFWQQVLANCYQAGLLINIAGGSALRMLPPLTVTDAEIEQAVSVITAVLKKMMAAEPG